MLQDGTVEDAALIADAQIHDCLIVGASTGSVGKFQERSEGVWDLTKFQPNPRNTTFLMCIVRTTSVVWNALEWN